MSRDISRSVADKGAAPQKAKEGVSSLASALAKSVAPKSFGKAKTGRPAMLLSLPRKKSSQYFLNCCCR